ncbi:MAG: prepilin-type N-terminal cleavage/methylation domain-containing protein [Candidatus Hydrogenedentota bacterium]|jgi:prepilin-type N-terminal cleavage/methylation domain-containing protein|nr:MAG: prepilin-type N-terminal cleavage/methylation domain-containing protein [Candidatus Hydrogenedentota bacterium]GIX44513.1 MAG: hypothetical protein KatS3mg130_0921 [Candidatus Sumerlaea sp.]
MTFVFMQRPQGKGFSLLEMVLVVTVLLLLTTWYFRPWEARAPFGVGSRPGDEIHSVHLATACLAQRASFRSAVEILRAQRSSDSITTQALEKAGIRMPLCPAGGKYLLSPQGVLSCTLHGE